MPILPDVFSFAVEYIIEDTMEVLSLHVWHDRGVARYDYHLPSGHTVTEIHDTNSGLQYLFNDIVGNCTLHVLSNTTRATTLTGDPAHRNIMRLVFDMKEAIREMKVQNSYSYIGTVDPGRDFMEAVNQLLAKR
ncbi:hypothetical protein ScPMuIL_005728 [Solemya velum]